MQTIFFTTQSGTVYEVCYTQTQEIVVRWDDPNYTGHPGLKGGKTKVWEHCTILGLSADPEIGMWHAAPSVLRQGLRIEGQNRYLCGPRGEISWQTTKIVSAVRADGKVLI
jgi:hypothetical protein